MGKYKISWSKQAYKDYHNWQMKDPKIAKKIDSLIVSIDRDGPVNGIGRPERLLNRKECSRRINDWHRLVYKTQDDVVMIMSCKGHTKSDEKLSRY